MELPPEPDPRRILEREIDEDPLNYYADNAAQVRFFDALRDVPHDRLTIVLFLKPNGMGGSWATIKAWSAMMWPTSNPRFQGRPFGDDWCFPKQARLCSTIAALGDKGPLQAAMQQLFPVGRWRQQRGSGKPYYSQGHTDTHWSWDCVTYDMSPLQSASANKSLLIFSEPPPSDIFTECVTRLRGRGIVIVEMTQLGLAPWAEEMADKGGLYLDGRKVGEVRVVRGDLEEACSDHHPFDPSDPSRPCGHRPHVAIEADIAAWPSDEREARRTGNPLSMSGRIYPKWSEANELDDLPDYHRDCWERGRVVVGSVIDPHDRKPWAMAWFATFPNNDVIAFAEWPPFEFHECKSSPVTDIEDYRRIILDAESEIGGVIKRRIMDPEFGEAANVGAAGNLFSILDGPCRECDPLRKRRPETVCPHRLRYEHGKAFPGSVNAGHMLIRAAIGDPANGVRPKLYAVRSACPNMCYGMRHYAYHEQRDGRKGLSERPQLLCKDMPDLPRYWYLSKCDQYPPETQPDSVELYKSPWRARNAVR